jgi:uncharacterized delta-60 repeat protein
MRRLAPPLSALLLAAILLPVGASAARRDPTFGREGFVLGPAGHSARVASYPGRRLIVAGGDAEGRFVIARYLTDGRLDPSFGEAGVAYVSWPGAFGSPHAAAAGVTALKVQPDGKILLGGYYTPTFEPHWGPKAVLARIDADGSVDLSFEGVNAEPGRATTGMRGEIDALAIEGGKIVIGGEGFVGRYDLDGERDTSFAHGHGWMLRLLPPRPGSQRARPVAVKGVVPLPGGGFYAAGSLGGGFCLLRISAAGRLDRRFGRNGLIRAVVPSRSRPWAIAEGAVRDHGGGVLVSGFLIPRRFRRLSPIDRGSGLLVARFNASGALDRGFGRGGFAQASVGSVSYGRGVAVQRDGRVIVAGASGPIVAGAHRLPPRHFTLVRFTPRGRLDRSFFDRGVLTESFRGFGGAAWDPLVLPSSRLVVSGDSETASTSGEREPILVVTRFLTE